MCLPLHHLESCCATSATSNPLVSPFYSRAAVRRVPTHRPVEPSQGRPVPSMFLLLNRSALLVVPRKLYYRNPGILFELLPSHRIYDESFYSAPFHFWIRHWATWRVSRWDPNFFRREKLHWVSLSEFFLLTRSGNYSTAIRFLSSDKALRILFELKGI